MVIAPNEVSMNPLALHDDLQHVLERSKSLLFCTEGEPVKGPEWVMCVRGNIIERSIIYTGQQLHDFCSLFFHIRADERSTGVFMDVFNMSRVNIPGQHYNIQWTMVRLRFKEALIQNIIQCIGDIGMNKDVEIMRVCQLLLNFARNWGVTSLLVKDSW